MSLVESLSVVFIVIALGFYCGRKKLFDESQIEGFEIFLFKIAIPFYLFSSILNHNFNSLINRPFIYSYILSFFSLALIVTLYFFRKEHASNIYIKILGAGYVNSAIFALPIITFVLGDPKAAIIANLIQVIIIQSIFLILLSFTKHKEHSLQKKLRTSLLSPMVLFPFIGMVLCYRQIKLPSIITTFTQSLGSGASGLALFVFGLTISRIKMNKEAFNRDLLFIVFAKNVIHPCIAILIGYLLFHLENYWLKALAMATAAPTAFLVYLIAKQFSTDTHFIRLVVAITSIISLVVIVLISASF